MNNIVLLMVRSWRGYSAVGDEAMLEAGAAMCLMLRAVDYAALVGVASLGGSVSRRQGGLNAWSDLVASFSF